MAPTSKTKASDWYSISVDTLRGWAIFLVLAGAAALGYFGFRQWNQYNAEHDAAAVIDEVLVLSQRLQTETGAEVYRTEYTSATEGLQQARTHFASGEFRTALDLARRSRALMVSVLDALGHHGAAGEAQFISVQGGVEFRNGESGEWESARARVSLRSGDYVKTGSSGSAELMFLDGTLYTVRPNTLFVVTRTRDSAGGAGEQSIRMEYGWVNLNTSQRSGTVSTPVAEARVDQQSEASVSYDQSTSASRFAALRGAMEVATSGGTTRSLQAMQQVVGAGAKISEAKAVAAAPTLLAPLDGVELNPASTKQLDLAWDAVPGAIRYALQVSRNRLFVDNIIDVDNRTKTRASLGAAKEPSSAGPAVSKDGFRALGARLANCAFRPHEVEVDSSDKAPPTLDLEDVKSYGELVRSSPAARNRVHGAGERRGVTVEADGSFTKTVQVAAEVGVSSRWARNAQGVETMRRHRVFVESL